MHNPLCFSWSLPAHHVRSLLQNGEDPHAVHGAHGVWSHKSDSADPHDTPPLNSTSTLGGPGDGNQVSHDTLKTPVQILADLEGSCARPALMTPGALELQRASLPWTPAGHYLRPLNTRRRVLMLLLVGNRVSTTVAEARVKSANVEGGEGSEIESRSEVAVKTSHSTEVDVTGALWNIWMQHVLPYAISWRC